MKTAIVIPTYNEAENIEKLLLEILELNLPLEIIVVDDNSPDGTGEIVRKLADEKGNIHLLSRCGKRREGRARIDGYIYALEERAEVIIEMDADFSHKTEYIPVFLSKIQNNDIIIGSRCISGGVETGRSMGRIFLSKLANLYIRRVYGIKNIFDCTSGYRCFKKEVFDKIKIEKLKAAGPAVIPEILFRAKNMDLKIGEFPIIYENRKKGSSKFTLKKIAESLVLPLFLRLEDYVETFTQIA